MFVVIVTDYLFPQTQQPNSLHFTAQNTSPKMVANSTTDAKWAVAHQYACARKVVGEDAYAIKADTWITSNFADSKYMLIFVPLMNATW
jgi:hypothetical protein